ncbi:MAG: hypothetical protein KY475_02825 [Planctomycetes bacterium]|nr:hypothetical protein [Planctomycetota bacterium]
MADAIGLDDMMQADPWAVSDAAARALSDGDLPASTAIETRKALANQLEQAKVDALENWAATEESLGVIRDTIEQLRMAEEQERRAEEKLERLALMSEAVNSDEMLADRSAESPGAEVILDGGVLRFRWQSLMRTLHE